MGMERIKKRQDDYLRKHGMEGSIEWLEKYPMRRLYFCSPYCKEYPSPLPPKHPPKLLKVEPLDYDQFLKDKSNDRTILKIGGPVLLLLIQALRQIWRGMTNLIPSIRP